MNYKKRNEENILFKIVSKIPKSKFNQDSEIPVFRNLYNIDEAN